MNIQKKVGIITFHESPNYGAILQAFALQKFLRDENYDVEIIDYCNPKRSHSQISGIKKLRSKIWENTFWRILRSKSREEKTERFNKKNLIFSEIKYVSSDIISKSPPIYDFYITGSDQVWNPKNNGYDSTYFLSFAPDDKKKISYAPSFGLKQLPQDYIEYCAPFIKRLQAISVREKSGAELVNEISGQNASVVIDPTFLLGRHIWDDVAVPPTQDSKGYIFCYYMPGDKIVEKAIKELSTELSLKTGLKIINAGKRVYERLKWWENTRYDAGPAEFVGLIRDASYVITNSFHGTAFSIIFNKEFCVPMRVDLPMEKALNSRMTHLLDLFGLQDRVYKIGVSAQNCNETTVIDYSDVNRKLAIEIEKSKEFILQALED